MNGSTPESFTYAEYDQILEHILATGRYCDFAEAVGRDAYVVLRHDVEFSPDRAYRLHLLENERGLRSSYLFQVTNNAYNAFSQRNLALIREIHQAGHHIGLHYHLGVETDLARIHLEIRRQADMLSEMTGIEIDRFSIHRPTARLLKANLSVERLINLYAPPYFTYAEHVDETSDLQVKYVADSMRRWAYGYPSAQLLQRARRLQILAHPDSWTEAGGSNADDFRALIHEKRGELLSTLDSECKHFGEVKGSHAL